MDVSSLLTDNKSYTNSAKPPKGTASSEPSTQQSLYTKTKSTKDLKDTIMQNHHQDGHSTSMSNTTAYSRNNATTKGAPVLPPKNVTFEYLLTEDKQARARLPMRVNIYPHDETNSIITTVKNFYGIYDGSGVAFEDKSGNTLIARYENLEDKHTVYVRVLEGVESKSTTPAVGMSPSRPRLAPPFELGPAGANISRPSSRTARYRSTSPAMKRFQRGQSVSSFSKSRGKSGSKGRTGSTQGSVADTIMHGDASDSDGGASVTSSRRAKVDAVASAEISVENIVEGGRRKRARFDSSELPLFQPSQIPMPGSVSSLSPQRRVGSQAAASPFAHANSYTFSYSNALPSPSSHQHSDLYQHHNTSAVSLNGASYGGPRRIGAHHPARHSYPSANGILPTPDPTIGSVISDEDVARQLMALGDPSNFGFPGARASTSTLDDHLSGKAEVASSAGGSDGSEVDERDMAERGGHSEYESEEEYEDRNDASFKGESDGVMPEQMQRSHGSASSANNGHSLPVTKSHKTSKPRVSTQPKKKTSTSSSGKVNNTPMSPTSLPPHSRKPSVSHQPLGVDEEDLSSKPRCQRCRKSKKGCDRQRPCGRCRDAGIGADGCISEDEGNGRKGRYGRHMGVTVKKFENEGPATPGSHMQAPIQQSPMHHGHGHGHGHSHSQSQSSLGAKLGPIAMSPPQQQHHHHQQQPYGHAHVQQWQQPQHHSQPMHMHPYHQMFAPAGAMAAPNFLPDKRGQKRKR